MILKGLCPQAKTDFEANAANFTKLAFSGIHIISPKIFLGDERRRSFFHY